ncbi:hypothetical protein [Dawidia soli]|uniref:DUF5017 domain-containing protein n=1 Tax=Dawidia soli TaxID=2782352 RepID=A0AAP2GGS2_9BACT|nr:hypothetical protein [Dawidia soli]MBT1686421.1 hypothetical protein [Dawidia soli]
MKNYLNYMAGIASLLVVFACDPYEDIYDELDARGENYDYTLVDADYNAVAKVDGGADIAKNKNFTSVGQAKEFIPHMLAAKYPKLQKGSKVQVTYKLYSPIRVDSIRPYTLTEADYNAITEPTLTLQNQSDVFKAATYVWPAVENFDLLNLKYSFPVKAANGDPAQKDSVSKVLRYNDAWLLPYVITRADYRFMGQSFDNFDNRTTAIDRIAILFNQRFLFANKDEVRFAAYAFTYTVGGARVTVDEIVMLTYTGTQWAAQQDVMPATLSFEYDGATWIPDNTIAYRLAAADYKAIAANKGLGNSDADNANSFGNFDRRSSSANYWDDTEITAGLDFLLQSLFPNAAEGQKYAVTFAVYTGSAGFETVVMIKEGGKYVRFVK